MIEVSLPGLFVYSKLNFDIVELKEKFPEKFRDDVFIGSVYGSFPNCWNGGRIIEGGFDMNIVINTVEYFNSKNIKIRYTFTNSLIGIKELEEWIPNQILQITKNHQTLINDVNVSSEELEKHLRNVHPEFRILYSTTKMLKTIDEINNASERGLVVPDYNVNADINLLKSLKHPENIELLVSETCMDNCPHRKSHYENIARCQLQEDIKYIGCAYAEDYANGNITLSTIKNFKHSISYKKMNEVYLPIGINKAKIAGRKDNPLRAIEAYLDYLVKDEYQDEIRLELIKGMVLEN